MFQLKFDDKETIIKDLPHWDNIPQYLIDFAINISDKRILYNYNDSKYYCSKCLCELSYDLYCKNCNISHSNIDRDNINDDEFNNITYIDFFDKKYISYYIHYFIFDVVDSDVYLYLVREDIIYDNKFYEEPFKTSKFTIDQNGCFLVEKDGVTNIYNNNFIRYEDMVCDNIFSSISPSYLYLENIDKLKKTIYRYSKFWKLKNYLVDYPNLSIYALTKYPLYYDSFEYLINYGLYDLAITSSDEFIKGDTFEEIFGVEKKYLPMMKKNNITYLQLELLRNYKTNDFSLIKFYDFWYTVFKDDILKYNINLEKLRDYFFDHELKNNDLPNYFDYLHMAGELGYDTCNNDVLFPNDLYQSHYEVNEQIEIKNDPELENKIRYISNMLSINNYEDDKYVIYPPKSIDEFIEESKMQHNCIRTYISNVGNGETMIYFMRKKDDVNKSFVTIEVRGKKVIQARVKYNELPNNDIMNIINKWERTLIEIKID